MATTPLCVWFFRCRIDVLQSYFSRSAISFAKFSVFNSMTVSGYESKLFNSYCVAPGRGGGGGGEGYSGFQVTGMMEGFFWV